MSYEYNLSQIYFSNLNYLYLLRSFIDDCDKIGQTGDSSSFLSASITKTDISSGSTFFLECPIDLACKDLISKLLMNLLSLIKQAPILDRGGKIHITCPILIYYLGLIVANSGKSGVLFSVLFKSFFVVTDGMPSPVVSSGLLFE